MILTVDELRGFISSELEDDALQLLLDAAEEAIVRRAGAAGTRVELVGGGNRLIFLARPVSAITSITELVGTTTTTFDATDYYVHPDGYIIERLSTGTNGGWRWRGRVVVTYIPVDDTAQRQSVQIDLLRSGINYNPGVTSEQIGAWMQQYQYANAAWNHNLEWDAILSRLDHGSGMLVVGSYW